MMLPNLAVFPIIGYITCRREYGIAKDSAHHRGADMDLLWDNEDDVEGVWGPRADAWLRRLVSARLVNEKAGPARDGALEWFMANRERFVRWKDDDTFNAQYVCGAWVIDWDRLKDALTQATVGYEAAHSRREPHAVRLLTEEACDRLWETRRRMRWLVRCRRCGKEFRTGVSSWSSYQVRVCRNCDGRCERGRRKARRQGDDT